MTSVDTKAMRERFCDDRQLSGTHYEDCWMEHKSCAILRLCKELDRQRDLSSDWEEMYEACAGAICNLSGADPNGLAWDDAIQIIKERLDG